jgi:hypothetical protein
MELPTGLFSMADVPPNIQEFNTIAGLVFALAGR